MAEQLDALIERVYQLEIKTTYQEDTIEALNNTIGKQHQDIQTLRYQITLLSDYLKGLKQQLDSGIKMPNEEVPPPHY